MTYGLGTWGRGPLFQSISFKYWLFICTTKIPENSKYGICFWTFFSPGLEKIFIPPDFFPYWTSYIFFKGQNPNTAGIMVVYLWFSILQIDLNNSLITILFWDSLTAKCIPYCISKKCLDGRVSGCHTFKQWYSIYLMKSHGSLHMF